jgi:hypothetical protein
MYIHHTVCWIVFNGRRSAAPLAGDILIPATIKVYRYLLLCLHVRMQVVMHVDINYLMRILRPLSINACIGCCYKDRGYGTLALSLACQFSSTCTASCRLPPSGDIGSPRLCAHRSAALDPLDCVPSVTTPFHRQHDHAAGGISRVPELPALECSRSSGRS